MNEGKIRTQASCLNLFAVIFLLKGLYKRLIVLTLGRREVELLLIKIFSFVEVMS
jgi:hypothetical protein